MKGLSVINMKGGVGKTTVAVNLGWEAAYAGLDTLVVDLDPQFNASVYLMGEDAYESDVLDKGGLTVVEIFERPRSMRRVSQMPRPTPENTIRTVLRRTRRNGRLDVIPSHLELAGTLKNPAGKEMRLASHLDEVRTRYDLVIVDPPPTDSMATEAAYHATDYVLIPVRPEFLSSIGFPLLARSVEGFKEEFPNSQLEVVGMFLSNVSNRHPDYEKTKEATRLFADSRREKSERWPFLEMEIRNSTSYTRGSREGSSIAATPYARGAVKDEFSELAEEVFGRMGL